MKALTLRQPWATLVATGTKHIETRSWKTSYRGPLAIHAAKDYPKECREICTKEPFRSALRETGWHPFGIWHKSNNQLPLGAIIAVAEMIDCTPVELVREKREKPFGNYAPGRWAWVLSNVRPLPEPIPAKGALGLWEWEPPEGFKL